MATARIFISSPHICRYPPFDPFNTTYIPLPGPSSPAFALPLDSEDPFMRPGRFIRQIVLYGNGFIR
jgi:hypothetical protein